MDGHFRAFSFVDRITELRPGVVIRGCYTIPPAVTSFPLSLVSEAVGQLAAWAAMAAVDFTHRPVAGIAGAVELLSEVHPGQVVELEAELQSVDNETVGYSGSARVGGQPVIRLHDCVGPMLPVEEFDDPQNLRERFALLRADGAAPGAFEGVPVPDLRYHDGAAGQVKRATLQVPGAVPFFADHFPRRNVFPGTLLMHASLETAAQLAREVPDGPVGAWQPVQVSDVKLRTFIPPGQTLTLEAKRTEQSNGSLCVLVETRNQQRLICSAEIRFVSKGPR
jgi:3-hydroxymyristoyl/3-hydroxydecanoyl-(acyl carrier protein) dehydratase